VREEIHFVDLVPATEAVLSKIGKFFRGKNTPMVEKRTFAKAPWAATFYICG
jgi:hypothetical protein